MASGIKVAMVGPPFVGKTSIVKRLAGHNFQTITRPTIGACFDEIMIDRTYFNIWDTAGEERFRSIAPLYYRGAHILIFVFDVTSSASLDEMCEFFDEAVKNSPNGRVNAHFIIVGNKIDRLHPDHVNIIDRFRRNKIVGTYALEKLDIIFTSAQDGIGLNLLEQRLLELSRMEITTMDVSSIRITELPPEPTGCSC
jgi:small GTP-binding protein